MIERDELVNTVEAVLYTVGKRMTEDEIAKLTKEDKKQIRKALETLQEDYKERNTSLMIHSENESWKLLAKEGYSKIIRKLISEVELTSSVMKTLSVIAWKQPVLQSDVVNIRGTSIYDHITVLENMGFLHKEHFGRSYLLRTTEKFADYFELEGGKDIRKILDKAREKHERKLLREKVRMDSIKGINQETEPENEENSKESENNNTTIKEDSKQINNNEEVEESSKQEQQNNEENGEATSTKMSEL